MLARDTELGAGAKPAEGVRINTLQDAHDSLVVGHAKAEATSMPNS
jgi:hypothetical protein